MSDLSPIRILRIVARMNVGGPAIQITGLEQKLRSDIFEHRLVTGYCDNSEIDYLIKSGIEIQPIRIDQLGKTLNFIGDFISLFKIITIVRFYKPHIIHTHTAKAGLLGRIAALLSGRKIRLIHTFHGHLLYGYFNSFLKFFVVSVEKFLASKTDILISVGKRVRDELLSAGIGTENQYRIVNPGLAIAPLPTRDSALSRLGLNPDIRYISWLGRLVQIKRPDRLLEIAGWLKKSHPDVRIVVAGDGPMRKDIEQVAESSELPIEFVGWILDIESILAVSEMMILTSDNEGTPLSLIQAQMAGLPVVATDVGSVSEIVINNETGFVVPIEVKFITEAINKLLLDRENAHLLGQKARVRALELYSVERLVHDHENIYLEIMKSI